MVSGFLKQTMCVFFCFLFFSLNGTISFLFFERHHFFSNGGFSFLFFLNRRFSSIQVKKSRRCSLLLSRRRCVSEQEEPFFKNRCFLCFKKTRICFKRRLSLTRRTPRTRVFQNQKKNQEQWFVSEEPLDTLLVVSCYFVSLNRRKLC